MLRYNMLGQTGNVRLSGYRPWKEADNEDVYRRSYNVYVNQRQSALLREFVSEIDDCQSMNLMKKMSHVKSIRMRREISASNVNEEAAT